jgi:hypothetical protein
MVDSDDITGILLDDEVTVIALALGHLAVACLSIAAIPHAYSAIPLPRSGYLGLK